jgi:hypothetical protein
MPRTPTPWVGLAALLAMFVLPRLPAWLFEGPRTIRHRPRRHVCGDCNAPWTQDHTCPVEAGRADLPLHGELRRLAPSTELERRHRARISRTDGAAHAARVHGDGAVE